MYTTFQRYNSDRHTAKTDEDWARTLSEAARFLFPLAGTPAVEAPALLEELGREIPAAAAETLLGLAAAAGDQVEDKQLREVARALAAYAERLWVYHSYGQPFVLAGPNDATFVDEIEGLWAQVSNIGDLPAPVPPNFPTPDFAL